MGKRNFVLLQGPVENFCPVYYLVQGAEKTRVQDDSWLLLKAMMLGTVTVRLVRRVPVR